VASHPRVSSAVGIPITVQPWNELAWLTDPSVVAEALNHEFEETRPEDVEGGTLGTWSRSVVRRRIPQRVRASRRLSCSRFAVREGNAPQQRGKRAFARGETRAQDGADKQLGALPWCSRCVRALALDVLAGC